MERDFLKIILVIIRRFWNNRSNKKKIFKLYGCMQHLKLVSILNNICGYNITCGNYNRLLKLQVYQKTF
jgi:hypothetical protein